VQFTSSSPPGQWRTPSHLWSERRHDPSVHSNWLFRQAKITTNAGAISYQTARRLY